MKYILESSNSNVGTTPWFSLPWTTNTIFGWLYFDCCNVITRGVLNDHKAFKMHGAV